MPSSKRTRLHLKYPLDHDDMYLNTISAVSLKRLSKYYDGACLRVRRSSDNEEKDIYFKGLNVDKVSIQEFCGSGDGFVVKWYDQSQNSQHLEQTANTNYQPQICSSGVYIENGVDFDDTATMRLDRLTTGKTCKGIYINFELKKEVTTSNANQMSWNIESTYGGIKFGGTTGYLADEIINIGNYHSPVERSGWCDASAVITANAVHKLLCTFDSATPRWNIKYDGVDRPITTFGTPLALSADLLRIGGRGDSYTQWLDGYCTTFIVFDTAILNYRALENV